MKRAWSKRVGQVVLLVVVVVGLMLWLMGAFHAKVKPHAATAEQLAPAAGLSTVPVKKITILETETATGTVRPIYESAVGSKVMEKVLEVNVKAGQAVHKGDVLIRLDDKSLKSDVGRAQAALDSAKANRDRAKSELDATAKAFKVEASSKIDLERADNAYKSAEADVQRAEEALNSARIALDYSVVCSPMDGIIIDKKVNVGDTAAPGEVLLTLYDPQRMQLVARVRESLAQRLKVGQQLDVQVSSDKPLCHGTVTEIVPEAESASRTFSVKVSGPCEPGVYAGTFGRLRIPLDTQDVLVIPATSVTHIGQLDMVRVVVDGKVDRRAVRLGRNLPEQGNVVEVLSGLSEGEKLVEGAMATTPSSGPASNPTVHGQPKSGLTMPPTTEAAHE